MAGRSRQPNPTPGQIRGQAEEEAEARRSSRDGGEAGAGTDPRTDPRTDFDAEAEGEAGAEEGIEVLVTKPKRKTGAARRKEAKAKAEAEQIAQALIEVLNMGAVAVSGTPSAVMQPGEQAKVEPPLTRILARMDTQAVETFQKFADPIALAMGLGMWGVRVASIAAMQRQAQAVTTGRPPRPQTRPQAAPPPAPNPAPTHGDAPTEQPAAPNIGALSPALAAILTTHTGGE